MSRRVLVVDDEPDVREIAQVSLEAVAGWQVSTACGGAEALALAARERPEAILLDVMMPEMDGPTTLRRLAEQPETASIPVLFLTAKVHASDRSQFAGLDVAGIIGKPFDPMTLADQVAGLLGWSP